MTRQDTIHGERVTVTVLEPRAAHGAYGLVAITAHPSGYGAACAKRLEDDMPRDFVYGRGYQGRYGR